MPPSPSATRRPIAPPLLSHTQSRRTRPGPSLPQPADNDGHSSQTAPRQMLDTSNRDPRRPLPHRAGLPQRGFRRSRPRRRRDRLRPRPVQVFHLRRVQQMPAPPLVRRAQHRPPRARSRSKERHPPLAVQRLGQSRPTRLEICRERDRRSPTAKKGRAHRLRTKAAPHPRSPLSRLHYHAPDQRPPIWRNPSAPSTPADCCEKASPRSRFSESTPAKPNPRSTRP